MAMGIITGIAVVLISAYIARITAIEFLERTEKIEIQKTKSDEKAIRLMKQWDNLFAYNGKAQDTKEEMDEQH